MEIHSLIDPYACRQVSTGVYRMLYDTSNYVDFTIDSGGDLNLNSTKASYTIDLTDAFLTSTSGFGFGTASPNAFAEISAAFTSNVGQFVVSSSGGSAAGITINPDSTSDGVLYFRSATTLKWRLIYDQNIDKMRFYSDSGSKNVLVMDTAGDVEVTTDLRVGNDATVTQTLTAEQVTSTDDITMQGHLLTMGDVGAATDTVISILGSTNSATITYDESGDLLNFGSSDVQYGGDALYLGNLDCLNIRDKDFTASTYIAFSAGSVVLVADSKEIFTAFKGKQETAQMNPESLDVDTEIYTDAGVKILRVDAVEETLYLGDGGTTNYVSVSATGDTTFAGGAGLVFGSCYGNHIGWSQANAVQNTWYNIADADMLDGVLHNVTHDGNGKLTVTEPGMYLINYSVCFEDTVANDHIEIGIEVSGSGSANAAGQSHLENKFASEEEHTSSSCILDLADNATIEAAIRTTDAGTPDISVQAVNITAVQVGGT